MKLGEKKFIFTSTTGVKFYDTFFTGKYKKFNILLAEEPNGRKTYVAFKNKIPVAENQNIESLYIKLDILRMIK